MMLLARGWSRDHGEKEIFDAEIEDAPVNAGGNYSFGKTYLEVDRRKAGKIVFPPRVKISHGATVNLNGTYLLRTILTQSEIARLFYLTHSDIRELSDLVKKFASFKNDDYPGRLS